MEKTLFGHWICMCCESTVDRCYVEDQGDRDTGPMPTIICPNCGCEDSLEEAEMCFGCTNGWKLKTDCVCDKCQKRLRGAIRLFLRDYNKHERAFFDDLLDGNSVEDLV